MVGETSLYTVLYSQCYATDIIFKLYHFEGIEWFVVHKMARMVTSNDDTIIISSERGDLSLFSFFKYFFFPVLFTPYPSLSLSKPFLALDAYSVDPFSLRFIALFTLSYPLFCSFGKMIFKVQEKCWPKYFAGNVDYPTFFLHLEF